MGLRSSLAIAASATQTSALDLTSASAPVNFSRSVALGSGTGAGKADRMWTDRRQIAASGTDDLDLVGSALVDPFGVAVTFARVKGLFIAAADTNVNNLVIGAAAGAPWAGLLNAAGTITIRPGGACAFIAGDEDATAWAVTATTADLLRVANSGAGSVVDYDIVIIGASA